MRACESSWTSRTAIVQDEQWDELNELEISLAQGNRQGAPQPGQGQRDNRQQMQPGQKPKGPNLAPPNKRFIRKHKKR